MKKFLLMIGIAFFIFFASVFVERRDIFLLPFLAKSPMVPPAAEGEALRETVRRYNLTLVEAYRRDDVSILEPLIGDGELREALADDFRFLAAQGKRLELELVSQGFGQAQIAGEGLGFVAAREEWRYGYTDARSRRPMGVTQTVRAEVTYTLERREGAWRIVETGLKRRLSDRAG